MNPALIRCTFALLLCFFFIASSSAQEKIKVGLKSWLEKNPQEKVFVQTDRSSYVAGETIWLKTWCTLDGLPSYLSHILYVELTGAAGLVLDKKMLHLDGSASAAAAIQIPATAGQGAYSLNAYTLWMLNYPPYVFSKQVYIFSNEGKKTALPSTANEYSLRFFPEGGDMIEEVTGRIAFKCVDKNGLPEEVTGAVESNGTRTAGITTLHDGMGFFELTPKAGVAYTAKVRIKDKTYTYPLPASRKEGVGLQVVNTAPSRLFVQLGGTEAIYKKYSKLYIVAHMSGAVVYTVLLKPLDGETAFSIPKKNLPPGILHITLFDSTEAPLAERLTFIANQNIIAPEVKVTAFNSGKRQKNTFEFKLDSLTAPDVSVLVKDAAYEDAMTWDDNIVSSLLLTSDVKGYVHLPQYYFSDKEPATLQHLDLLLMTQGWRRFSWKEIRDEASMPIRYAVESFLTLKGKVTKSDRSSPVTTGSVSFVIKTEDSSTIISTARLSDKGTFFIDSLDFPKQATVSYQANNSKNSFPVDVAFYPEYIDTLQHSTYVSRMGNSDSFTINNATKSYAHAQLDTALTGKGFLKNIIVKGRYRSRIDSLQSAYVSPLFINSDQTLEIPEKVSYVNIWQYLNSQVPGFQVNPFQVGGVTTASFSRYEALGLPSADTGNGYAIQFVLNEVNVTADVIDALSPADVALIKIYKGALASPLGADAGAIAIYTKKGASAGLRPYDKRFEKMIKRGFDYSREFYSPDYTQNPSINNGITDQRITLQWIPGIKAEKDGTYRVTYHNNDTAEKCRITIQGIDKDGHLIFRTFLQQR